MTRKQVAMLVGLACRLIGDQYRLEKEVARRLAIRQHAIEESARATQTAGQ